MPRRILIADDHESVLRRVRAIIEARPDWQVCAEAVNGREAVDKANELDPDLVILDFAMPHLNGLKAATEIHALLPQTPIVMLTMYGTQLTDEIKKHGISRLVEKEQPGALVNAVEELLAQKEPTPKKAPAPVPLSPARDPVSEVRTKRDVTGD